LKLESHDQRLAKHPRLILGLCVIVAALPIFTVVGLPDRSMALGGLVALLHSLISAGILASAYLLAGVGLAWPLAAALCPTTSTTLSPASRHTRRWLQVALGAALMPWLSHALGVLGLLSGRTGFAVAVAVLVIGGALLATQAVRFFRAAPRLPDLPTWPLAGAIATAILLLAAVNPPGWLWRSEAGGFDALSYHLPLAQEWAEPGGRIWPLQHNVYSFLPSYIEASFTHIAAILGGSLTASDGLGALTCQLIHALYTLLAAALLYKLVTTALTNIVSNNTKATTPLTPAPSTPAPSTPAHSTSAHTTRVAALIAAQALLATPWVIVTGSLAYNEMAMLAMLTGACAFALDRQLSPPRRALVAGLLLGIACGFKPTALLLGGPTIALLLLIATPPRAWPRMIALGALAGLITFGPPLLRNFLACGNPLFPAATNLFHTTWPWNADQIANFANNHAPQGTFTNQLARLIEFRPSSAVDTQPRGLLHTQWGILFPVGLAALAATIALARRRPTDPEHTAPESRPPSTRAVALALLLGTLAGLLAWALFTHAQSRFLMPLAINLAAGVGLAAAMFAQGPHRAQAMDAAGNTTTRRVPLRQIALLAASAIPLIQAATLVSTFLREGGGSPNQLLVAGVSARTGELLASQRSLLSPSQWREALESAGPEAAVNLRAPELTNSTNPTIPARVYLLGDATPLYYHVPVLYHTVWDASPLGNAIRAAPDEPDAWTAALANQNVAFVVVNFSELARYWRTYGYDPAVTPQAVVAWVSTLGEPLEEWAYDEQGLELTWRDIVAQNPRQWNGRALWRISPTLSPTPTPIAPSPTRKPANIVSAGIVSAKPVSANTVSAGAP